MFKFLACSFLSFMLLIVLSSSKEKANEQVGSNSLLWKIEGNGLKQPSYLFGTMHLIQKEYFYFPDELEKIVRKSTLLITEINLDELDNQMEALRLSTLAEGKITDLFNTQQKDSLLLWAKNKLMMDEATFLTTFGKFKPIVIIQMATQLAFFGKTESYEITLKNLAKKHKVMTAGLETMKDQFSFFDSLSMDDQVEMVMEAIREDQRMVEEMNRLQRAYRAQQLDSLEIMIQQDKSVITKNENTLLINRNLNWIPKIEKYMQQQHCFIAVGAAHLIGPTGVIQLLKNKGYQVVPVTI